MTVCAASPSLFAATPLATPGLVLFIQCLTAPWVLLIPRPPSSRHVFVDAILIWSEGPAHIQRTVEFFDRDASSWGLGMSITKTEVQAFGSAPRPEFHWTIMCFSAMPSCWRVGFGVRAGLTHRPLFCCGGGSRGSRGLWWPLWGALVVWQGEIEVCNFSQFPQFFRGAFCLSTLRAGWCPVCPVCRRVAP